MLSLHQGQRRVLVNYTFMMNARVSTGSPSSVAEHGKEVVFTTLDKKKVNDLTIQDSTQD